MTDLLDVLLEEGVVLQADVVVSVADVPLVGVNLRAAVAGMATMTEHGFFEEWDREVRGRAESDRAEMRSAGSPDPANAPETAETPRSVSPRVADYGGQSADGDGSAPDDPDAADSADGDRDA